MSGRVFSAGESMNVFTPHDEAKNPIPFDRSNPLWVKLNTDRSRVTVEICYCSTLGECWTLRGGGTTPSTTTATRRCPIRRRLPSSSSQRAIADLAPDFVGRDTNGRRQARKESRSIRRRAFRSKIVTLLRTNLGDARSAPSPLGVSAKKSHLTRFPPGKAASEELARTTPGLEARKCSRRKNHDN